LFIAYCLLLIQEGISIKVDLFYKENKPTLGVDIGATSIKVVQLKKSGHNTKLVGYGNMGLPGGCVSEGIIYDPENVAKYIKKLLEEPKYGKFKAKRVNSAIPESYIFTRVLELPEMTYDDMEQAITWDAEQYIPIALSDLYIDFEVLGPALSAKEGYNDVALVAAPRAIVDSYMKMFDLLNLEVGILETNLSSIARAVVSQKEINETIVLADIGGERTNMAIFDRAIRVTGSLPRGGVDFTRAIAEKCKINILEAEETKNQDGLPAKNGKVKEAMEPILLEIVRDIKKIINYYEEKSGNKKNLVSKIIICGGNASIPGLMEYLQKAIDLRTIMGNPWANISIYPLKPVPKLEAPMYTAAIGLALKGSIHA